MKTTGDTRLLAGIPIEVLLIDCDVHVPAPTLAQLRPFLNAQWAEYAELTGFSRTVSLEMTYPAGGPTTTVPSGAPEAEESTEGALSLVKEQVLDTWNVCRAVLNCAYPLESISNPDLCNAIAQGINDWLIAEWLDKDPRLRASLLVPPHYPDLAVAEIERVGDHPGFVQVLLPVRSEALYGHRRFHSMFGAATEHGLPVGLHFGGYAPGTPPTGSGWPSYYLEEYAGMAQVFQSQLRNIVFEGVFDRYPEARLALIESGFAWLPALVWRLDADWRNMGRETPWLRRPPSEYIREHVKVTLQPVDGPDDAQDMSMLFEQLGSDELLMFSTDYPHMQFESPERLMPIGVGQGAARKMFSESACDFYGWRMDDGHATE